MTAKTDTAMAERDRQEVADIKRFIELYPPAIMQHVRDNLMRRVLEALQAADMTAEAEIIEHDFTTLDRYFQLATNPDELAQLGTGPYFFDACLSDELAGTLGKGLAFMNEHQKLDAWI